MAGKIKVTPERIKSAATKIKPSVESYNGAIRDLYTNVDDLSVKWTGQANLDFTNKIKEAKKSFEDLGKVLENYITFLNEASRIYSDTETNVSNAAKKL